MAEEFHIEVDDSEFRTVAYRLDHIGDSELMRRIADMLLSKNQDRFMLELSPNRVPWIPSRSGEARKRRGTGQTLYRSGDLFRSIGVRSRGKVWELYADAEYAGEHQFGIGQIPRPFLGVSEEDERDVEDLIEDFLSTFA